MKLITAPSLEKALSQSLFLAGGISGCSDWRSQAIEMLGDTDLTVFNPRRENYGPSMEEEQIEWEYGRLRISDIIVFWFPCETDCPITLYELGVQVGRQHPCMAVGHHPQYSRRNDLHYQIRLACWDAEIYTNLEQMIDNVKAAL